MNNQETFQEAFQQFLAIRKPENEELGRTAASALQNGSDADPDGKPPSSK